MTITLNTDPTERIAAYPLDHPRAWRGIVAVLLPDAAGTLRATASGRTFEELDAQDGPLRLTTWDEWQAGAAAAQAAVPVLWQPCTQGEYRDRLEVLPPIAWAAGSFCVGEPADHDVATGRPRYQAYRAQGEQYYRSSRPVTVRELQANRATGPGRPWATTTPTTTEAR